MLSGLPSESGGWRGGAISSSAVHTVLTEIFLEAHVDDSH